MSQRLGVNKKGSLKAGIGVVGRIKAVGAETSLLRLSFTLRSVREQDRCCIMGSKVEEGGYSRKQKMRYTERVEDAEGIYILDTEQFGLPKYGSLYILKAPRPAIIETGFSHTVPKVLSALAGLQIKPEEVAYIMPTHVHLDHAGGAGFLAEVCSNAQVVIHEKGAEHLIEPIRLVESVKRAVGVMFAYYGEVKPIPADRVIRVRGGEKFDLGNGLLIEAMDTPGHAPHHACFYERKNKVLFVGDAVGIYRPFAKDALLPTTPPPSFHLEQSLETLERLKRLDLNALCFTHWGVYKNIKLLDGYASLLKFWVAEIEATKKKLSDDEKVKQYFVDKHGPELAKLYDPMMVRGEIEMNVQGVLLYLKRREQGASQV